MAKRYILLATRVAGAGHDLAQALSTQTDLHWVSTSSRLNLFADSPSSVHPLPDDQGAVIGDIFERGRPGPGALQALPESWVEGLVAGGGNDLLIRTWGAYICVIDHRRTRSLHILRDPSGALPCYYLKLGAVIAFASDVETLCDCGLLSGAADWDGLADHLYAPDLPREATALQGCRELLPGTRLTLSSGGPLTQVVWTPWAFTNDTAHMSGPSVYERLRTTLQDTLEAWAATHPRALLGLSGGLDSSVIAASLNPAGAKWTAFTMATQDAEGDERHYARLMASASGLPLQEYVHDLSAIEITRCSSGHLARPNGSAVGQSQNAAILGLAGTLDATAVVTGQGGDNIFCYMQSATPLVDRWRSEGWTLHLWKSVRDLCTLTGCSVGDAVWMAAVRARKGPRYSWPANAGFLHPDAVTPHRMALTHPWLEAPDQALPGKAVHIAKLLRIHGTLEGFPRRGPDLITPLLSQPVVEFCLGVPTWRWCEGGRDRAVVRTAFQGLVPAEILGRTSKSGPTSFALEVIETHRQAMRAFLLDGALVRDGAS